MRTTLLLLCAVLAAAVITASSSAADPAACRYEISTSALTGPTATDVSLRVTAPAGCADVASIKKVQLKIDGTGNADDVVNLDDVQAAGGVASITVGRVDRGRRIDANVLIQPSTRTYVLRDFTTAKLRPDLLVARVQAPPQTLTTRPVDVVASIEETNGDTGAAASVTLAGPLGPLAGPVSVTVPAGGTVTVKFPAVALTAAAQTDLKVIVSEAAPAEYDTSNDIGASAVEVTKNELAPSRVLVQSLGGYGFQLNHHLYAPITNADPATLPDLESKVKALEPQFVRIFYSENWEANSDGTHPEWQQNLESFRKVVELANASGATIVVAYQGVASAKVQPGLWMGRFADILRDLIVTRGLTNVRWITIGNEPNGGAVNLTQYEALYRNLDAALTARGIRDRVGLMAGDLVQNTEGTASGHRAWFDYMVAT